MDFELDEIQEQVVGSAEAMLGRLAGPTRARSLLYDGGGCDHALGEAILAAGYAEAATNESAGPLATALVVEAAARHVGCVALTGPLLVAPLVLGRTDLPALTLIDARRGALVRCVEPGPALVVDGTDASLVELDDSDITPVPNAYGYPLARVHRPAPTGAPWPVGERVAAWWRVGLALEAVGTMRGAMSLAVEYVKERHQFGRPIGTFQSIQHRLAATAAQVEGARWLALEAAWAGAPAGAAATAAGYAAAVSERVLRDAHQVHGAIGFTVEADLHLWTMRLQVLRLELGGIAEHRRISGSSWLVERELRSGVS